EGRVQSGAAQVPTEREGRGPRVCDPNRATPRNAPGCLSRLRSISAIIRGRESSVKLNAWRDLELRNSIWTYAIRRPAQHPYRQRAVIARSTLGGAFVRRP